MFLRNLRSYLRKSITFLGKISGTNPSDYRFTHLKEDRCESLEDYFKKVNIDILGKYSLKFQVYSPEKCALKTKKLFKKYSLKISVFSP